MVGYEGFIMQILLYERVKHFTSFYFVSKRFQNDKILIKFTTYEKKHREMKNISFFTCCFVIFVL